MVNPILVAAPVAMVPTFGALWYFLRRYQDYFQDARVFGSLIFGFFLGLIAAAFEFVLFRAHDASFAAAAGPGNAFLFAVFGYAFFEAGAKTAALGYRIYRGRRDTPYYGLALGLGFGSMWAVQFIAGNIRASEAAGNPYQFWPLVTMFLLPLGAVLAHGATGVWVGKGTAEGKLWKGWLLGALLQVPILGALWLYWPSIGQGNVIPLFPSLLAIVYGIGLLAITQDKVLDQVVPKEIKDQLQRERRRQARQQNRGGGGAALEARAAQAAAGVGGLGAAATGGRMEDASIRSGEEE